MAKQPPADQQSEQDRLAAEELDAKRATVKGHATPTRKEQEAARKRPLVAGNSPEARKAARAADQLQRDRARVGLANGEEKYLPVRDRGPQKRYTRDFVDARSSLGELAIPVVAILLVVEFVASTLQGIITIAVYGFFLLVIIDSIILTITLGRRLRAKFGADKVERYRWYAVTRALQFRVLRMPKPQVKRGRYPS